MMLHFALLPFAMALSAADPAQDAADARCVVAMASKLQSPGVSEDGKASIKGVMLYFLGKLAARHPSSELAGMIDGEGNKMLKTEVDSVGLACADEVKRIGNVLQGIE